MIDNAPLGSPRRGRGRLAIAVVLAIPLLLIAAWIAAGRRPVSGPKLPDPNGFDDLVAAGSRIRGDWPGRGDLDKADPRAMRAFVESNRAALDLARVGLGRDSLVHFENSEAGLAGQIEGQRRLRDVARLLTAEGRIAEAEGRIVDASRSFLDAMKVGEALTRDGMLTDVQIGWALEKQAGIRLRTLLDRLPKDDLKAVLRELESLDRGRVSPDAVVARWGRWYGGAFSPVQQTLMRWNGIEAIERANQRAQAAKAHDQAGRDLGFLRVQLAIHAHHLDRGTWPRSVGELVPAYLSAVPIDPGTGKPVNYPAGPSGELTDDLGLVGRADVEVKAPR